MTISLVLEKTNYKEHQWVICVDLKMVIFFLVNKVATQSTLAFYAFGRVDKHEHWARKDWLRGNIWWLEDKM